jgi:hypothetical protein
MEDGRRFLRFVSPGLMFASELLLLLWVAHPFEIASRISTLLNATNSSATAAAFAILLTSGAIGIGASFVHHTLHRYYPCKPDHRQAVADLVRSNKVVLRRSNYQHAGTVELSAFDVQRLSPMTAWSILTAIWHSQTERSGAIKAGTRRAESLADLVHMSGTMLIGTIAAFGASICFGLLDAKLGVFSSPAFWFVSITLLSVHALNYRNLVRQLNIFVAIVIHLDFHAASPLEVDLPPEVKPSSF